MPVILSKTLLKKELHEQRKMIIESPRLEKSFKNIKIKILRLYSPVAFLITLTALFKVSVHSEGWSLRYILSVPREKHQNWMRSMNVTLRLQLHTEMVCMHKHLGRNSKSIQNISSKKYVYAHYIEIVPEESSEKKSIICGPDQDLHL